MRIEIDVPQQSMRVLENDTLRETYAVSTAANGVGEQNGSECTPRGRHIIRAKIGAGAEPNRVFVGRRQTGELYTPELREKFPGRDWILTRILWLSGTQPGRNRLGQYDSMRRYIYIHGTPDDVELGKPGSRGCIRMRNQDIMELFDWVQVGTEVVITGENYEA
jgi:lipoprotein-anchoring transpeptidase ErfK/SrfK